MPHNTFITFIKFYATETNGQVLVYVYIELI